MVAIIREIISKTWCTVKGLVKDVHIHRLDALNVCLTWKQDIHGFTGCKCPGHLSQDSSNKSNREPLFLTGFYKNLCSLWKTLCVSHHLEHASFSHIVRR